MNTKHNTLFKKSLLSLTVVSAISTSFIAAANSETEADELETITVTASRSPMDVADSLASQVVITRADIELANPVSVLDLLSSLPSIDISSNGGKGQASSVFMRGTNSDHTLVVIDGIRISSATSGSASLNTISPEMIERIEIVQGPRAALWGSDAIGGVIQIFTRQLSGGEFFVGTSFGVDNYQKYKAGVGISHGDGQTSILISKEKSDGYDVKEGTETDDDGYDFNSIAIRGSQNVTKDFLVDWLFSSDEGDNEYDGYYNGSDIKNHAWLLRANYKNQIGNVKNYTTFSAGQNRDSADSLIDGASQGVFETRRNQFSALNNSYFSDELQLNIGLDYYQDDVSKSATVYNVGKRYTTGVFAHTAYSLNSWTYELTLRHDDVEKIDSESTFNLGGGYKINDDSRLVINYGTGFKAPTFNDLYYPFGGNEELVSELSSSAELFFETKLMNVNTSWNLYHSEVDNLIVWGGSQSENIEEVEINGFEFAMNFNQLGGTHDFNLSYTDAEDKQTEKQLIRRAKEKFNYKFTTQISDASIYIEYQFVGSRLDKNDVNLSSYQLLNLGLNYDVSDNISISSRVTNLLDEDYQTAYEYNTQERAFYLGVTYQN